MSHEVLEGGGSGAALVGLEKRRGAVEGAEERSVGGKEGVRFWNKWVGTENTREWDRAELFGEVGTEGGCNWVISPRMLAGCKEV